VAVVALAAIVIGGFTARKLLTKRPDAVATSTPEAAVAETPNAATNSGIAMASPSQGAANTNPTSTATANTIQSPQTKSTPAPLPATLDADPVLFPPDTRSTPTSKAADTDYSRVFNPREVDTKVKIISKPVPSYTDQARMNQVQELLSCALCFRLVVR
jgi:hypothetical protein